MFFIKIYIKESYINYYDTSIQMCGQYCIIAPYLGHLISADGIQPLPEKLESIAKMPAPGNPKEVKQFLRLVGYYRKFVPRFADISRVLTHLTKKMWNSNGHLNAKTVFKS